MNENQTAQEISIRYLIGLLISAWRWIIAAVLIGGALGAIPLFISPRSVEAPIYSSIARIYLDPDFSPYSEANVGIFLSDSILDELRQQLPSEFDLAIDLQPGINQKNAPGTLGLMVRSYDPTISQPLANAWSDIVLQWLREGMLASEQTEKSLQLSKNADSALFGYLKANGLGEITYCDITYIVGVDPCPAYVPSEKIHELVLSPEIKTELSGLILLKKSARENSLLTIANNNAKASVIDQHLFLYSAADEGAIETLPDQSTIISDVFPFIGAMAGFILAICVVLIRDWWIKGDQ